ncbi:hypothetical protein QF049_005207 [Paenibacillus sp. W4I10]|nr:hypothetical protein [Paenibacillus sp. W4I10]
MGGRKDCKSDDVDLSKISVVHRILVSLTR